MLKKNLVYGCGLALTAVALAACQSSSDDNKYNVSSSMTAPASHFEETYVKGHDDITTNLVVLTKDLPNEVSVGQTYQSSIEVKSRKPVHDAVVTDTVPAGMVVVKTEPQATQTGDQLVWHLGQMDRGDSKTLNIWLKAMSEGTGKTCTIVDAKPRTCHSIVVGKPDLVVAKTGPARVRLGDTFDYEITLKNEGSSAAKNVTVVDNMPAALVATGQTSPMTYTVGDLGPGESAKVMVVPAMGQQRGEYCNKAQVNADNHASLGAQACTTVFQPMIAIRKQSSDDEAFLGKHANYTVVVSNTGDVDHNNVVVTDVAPQGTRIVSAPGAEISGNTATWMVDQLAAGKSQNFTLALSSNSPGRLCNEAQVKASSLAEKAYFCTNWKGVPSVLVEMVDSRDSLLVGDTTEYHIRVTNQGTATDKNIAVQAVFPSNIKPMSVSGDVAGTIDGNVVTFSYHPSLEPKQSIEYVINAKAVAQGNNKVVVKVKTPSIDHVVYEEESTIVY